MVKEICNFDTGLASANNAIFDKSNTYLMVASEDTSVKIFNLQTKEKENELKGHEDAVLDLCLDSGKEGYLVTASSDCSFRIWQ
jgi:WD40 repeat protein